MAPSIFSKRIISLSFIIYSIEFTTKKKKKQNSKKDLLNVEELYLHLTEGVRWMNWLTQQEGRGVCKTRTADTCGWRMADADGKMRKDTKKSEKNKTTADGKNN